MAGYFTLLMRAAAGKKRSDRRDGERRTGTALFRHLVPVKRRDHRRRLAWNVDEDRGGRAAILGAVVDAGQHDQRTDRRQAEGDRQQHGDGGEWTHARQHSDQGADHGPDQAQENVHRRQGDAKTEGEIMKEV